MKNFRPIKWDGRERTADRILDAMPEMTISTWGGAAGLPRELFIHDRKKRSERKVNRGTLIGKNRKGQPCIVPHRIDT